MKHLLSRNRSVRSQALAFAASAAFAGLVAAIAPGTVLAGPTVELHASASSELPNDEMVVQLAVERAGPTAEKLNDEVLNALNLAIAKAKTVDGVKVRLGGVTTQPEWGAQGKRTGWRVRGVMVLQGKDLPATGALAGELSSDLQIAGVSFHLTEEARSREESRLLKQAATAFNERAREAAAAFGYGSFELKKLNVDHASPNPPRPMPMQMRASAAAAPQVPTDAGDATVTLTISGSVEFK
jgi:predicted secreted protein